MRVEDPPRQGERISQSNLPSRFPLPGVRSRYMNGTAFNPAEFLQDDAEVLPSRRPAAEHAWDIFPAGPSWANSDICPSPPHIRISQLLYHTNLFHEQAGAGAKEPCPFSGQGQSWQGEPPQTISTGGSSSPFSFVISPIWAIWGNLCLVTRMGKASISLAQRGTMPLRTAASGNPPIPSNRLANVRVFVMPVHLPSLHCLDNGACG